MTGKTKIDISWWNKREFIIKTMMIVFLAGAFAIAGYWLTNVSNKATPQNTIIYNPKSTPEQIQDAKDQRMKIWIGNFLIVLSTLCIGLATLYVLLREDHKMIKLLAVIAENTSKKPIEFWLE
jgi:hypothetical protein